MSISVLIREAVDVDIYSLPATFLLTIAFTQPLRTLKSRCLNNTLYLSGYIVTMATYF